MQTAEKPKKMQVTARQINTVALELRNLYPVLAQSYADLAAKVAVNLKGVTEIDSDHPLAVEIRELRFSTLD